MAVFREEKEKANLQKSQDKIQASFPLLVDLESKQTSKYSSSGFVTYIIDPEGKIVSVMPGTKSRRPMAKKILKMLRSVANE